jgi:hypothetical protein
LLTPKAGAISKHPPEQLQYKQKAQDLEALRQKERGQGKDSVLPTSFGANARIAQADHAVPARSIKLRRRQREPLLLEADVFGQ